MGTDPLPTWRDVARSAWQAGQRLSAVGPGAVDRHLDHAEAMASAMDAGATHGIDVGTGAGLPGLALAGLRPDMTWTLIDAAARRARLVHEIVVEVGWTDRVTVVHARAEDWAREHRGAYDVVVARLLAAPPVTAEWCAPLPRSGGQVLVSDPEDVDPAERWPDVGLVPLGLQRGRRWSDPTIQELVADGSIEARFPRKTGVAEKRPLW